MRLGFGIPVIGPAVSGAAGLAAFCRGLEETGYDSLWVADRLVTPVDVLSDGRLEVGVGLGWMKDEHDIARGADWHRRGKMLDDLLAFLHAHWPGVTGRASPTGGYRPLNRPAPGGSGVPRCRRWRRRRRPRTGERSLSRQEGSGSPGDPRPGPR
jgi:hypothetical protein